MGFGASNDLREASPQEPLGVDPKRTNTNEQGRPLPYFAGIAKLGVTWLSEPWDVRATPIRKKVGKKQETVGFNYYARAAAIVCHGPVDALDEIRFDDDVVWTGPPYDIFVFAAVFCNQCAACFDASLLYLCFLYSL